MPEAQREHGVFRYMGTGPFLAMRSSINVLNLMWIGSGSQWREDSNRVGMENSGRLKTSCAAAFWISGRTT